MKLKIYNNGKGWYTVAKNYKDKEDKAYLSVFFPPNRCDEPNGTQNEKGKSAYIEIEEASINSYQNKASGFTIFKYREIEDQHNIERNTMERITLEKRQNSSGTSYAGLKQDDLPFY